MPDTAREDDGSHQAFSPRLAADIDLLSIDTIRTLTIDAVEKARSGHAGAPLGMAPVGYTLWTRYLRFDPADPSWPNRDRFVLSAGHACMLLYALLHLSGVRDAGSDRQAVRLDDIRQFRELGSRCPGHPEHGVTPGVEATTGPLGQGIGDSVGMAIAERWLEQRYNRPGLRLFDYNIYALCSDGDLMEGVGAEAASLAGHLGLSNLCWIYDDNSITIEGRTSLAFSEDVAARFRAYGWNTIDVADANDCEAVARAIENFIAANDRPTLIRVKSVIGYGSPHKQGTAKAHSDPLGAEECRLTKRAYGWPEDSQFLVPDGVREHFNETFGKRGRKLRADWDATMDDYASAYSDLAGQLALMRTRSLPAGWDSEIPAFPTDSKGIASREASGKTLTAIAKRVDWIVGGAGDLSPSTKTHLDFEGAGDFERGSYAGRNFHFGVREHAMGAAANGLALSGLRPYTGTFLTFSDYMKPSIRLAAIMKLPVVFVFSHDSIGLGQDGPTHQPIEHLAALRAVPDLLVIRPCDANETAEAWRVILAQSEKPACLVLSRQALPTLDRARLAAASGLARGGYVLADCEGLPEVILIGTGSEISLCLEAHKRLTDEGGRSRVVSLASWEMFDSQPQAYRDAVLPPKVTARVTVEAGSPLGWDRYAGSHGEIIAMREFGASAPIEALEVEFGFTAEHVYQAAKRQLEPPSSGINRGE